MAAPDTDLFKDKIEVSLDGRQIFYLFFGGAVIATLVFVLGVMVGRRVEHRAVVETGSPVTDPLAALDRMESGADLAFPSALRGDDVALGAVDQDLAKRKQIMKPAVGGPLLAPTKGKAEHEDEAEGVENKAELEALSEPVAASPKKVEAPEKPVAAKADAAEKRAPKAPEPEKANKTGKRRFTLQVGSFQDKEEADAFFRQLESSPYDPYMVEAEVPGKGKYYRVRVGGYTSFDDALAAKSDFEDKQHVIAYVTRIK